MIAKHFDVLIAGSGPAGAACALALKDSRLKIALIDKAKFPRDKVCGDAIPTNALRVLTNIDSDLAEEFKINFKEKNIIKGSRLISPSRNFFDLEFVNSGHAATRLHFDNFLVELVKKNVPSVSLFENCEIKNVSTNDKCATAETTSGTITADVIVGCDGAHATTSKQLAGFKVDKRFYIGAVRSYYKNISDADDALLELHFLKDYMPGYFWIFPLGNNLYNVGFGMASDQVSKRKVNLRESFHKIIAEDKVLSARFRPATKTDDTIGFGLPCGGRKLNVSGNRFMLCGDAASLINPATGEGIGNAMISGRLAAFQIIKCFANKNFTAYFIKNYEDELYGKLYNDLRIQHVLQKVAGNRPWLVNFALNQVSKHEFIREKVRKFF